MSRVSLSRSQRDHLGGSSFCTAPSTVPGMRQMSGKSLLVQKPRKVTGSLRPLKQFQLLSGVNTADLRAQGTGDESLS